MLGAMKEYSERSWGSTTQSQFRGEQNTSRTVPIKRQPQSNPLSNPSTSFTSRFQSVNMEYNKDRSVLSKEYQRPKPAYNRVSASKTNFDVTDGTSQTKSTPNSSTQSAFAPPDKRFLVKERKPKPYMDKPHPRNPPGLFYNIVTNRYECTHSPF